MVSGSTREDMKARHTRQYEYARPATRSGQCLIKDATLGDSKQALGLLGAKQAGGTLWEPVCRGNCFSRVRASVKARGNCRLGRGNLNHVQKARPVKLYLVAAPRKMEE